MIIYLLYVILSCTVPYLLPVKIDIDTKEKLNSVDFYSDESNTNVRAFLIEKPADAFNIRIEIINSAVRTLDISYHNLQAGDTTIAFLAALYDAADRGVKVRMVLDAKVGAGDKAAKDGIALLQAHPNIEIQGYLPVDLLKPWEFPVVFHDKFIISDDEYLLLGGRNIGDRYFDPNGYNKPVTNDRDVFIHCSRQNEGRNDNDSIRQVQDYMNLLWNSGYTEACWRPMAGYKRTWQKELLKSKSEKIKKENPNFFLKSLQDYSEMSVPTNKITLLHNPINGAKKKPTLGYQLKRLALTAKQNVIIQTPYATANDKLMMAMKEVNDKSSLTMLTNSSASTPNFLAYSNYLARRPGFIDTGTKIYELQSVDSIHGKSMIVDNRISVIGSFNMDDRSFHIDTETMLVIDSPEFTKLLNDAIGDYIDNSLEVTNDNKYLDDPNVAETHVTFLRKFLLTLISVPSILFQYLI